LEPQAIHRYVIRAMADQTMEVDLLPTEAFAEREAILVIWGEDGTPLITDHAEAIRWHGPLPTTQDYFIDVRSNAATAIDYTLQVVIPPLSTSLTLEQLKNAEYHLGTEGSFQLVDGIHYLTPTIPDEPPEQWSVRLMEPMAFGDVNGDGADDAAVIIATRYGGTGIFEYLAIVANVDGQPFNVASTSLGDRTIINAISIEASQIHLDVITHAPEDGLCCPSRPETWTFELTGDELIDVSDNN
jgi:hypothetical protein